MVEVGVYELVIVILDKEGEVLLIFWESVIDVL